MAHQSPAAVTVTVPPPAGRPEPDATGIPMLIIANAYRRLNMWTASCSASFEWAGRSISPYLAS